MLRGRAQHVVACREIGIEYALSQSTQPQPKRHDGMKTRTRNVDASRLILCHIETRRPPRSWTHHGSRRREGGLEQVVHLSPRGKKR